jgi:hypothetical protein
MNKVFQFLSMAVIVWTAASCGGETPSGIAESMLKASKAGDSEKVVAIATAHLDAQTLAIKEAAKGLFGGLLGGDNIDNLIKTGLKALFDNSKKIADYAILGEKRSDDGSQAVVNTKVTYKDGSETTDKMTFVKENGKWKIKLSNF